MQCSPNRARLLPSRLEKGKRAKKKARGEAGLRGEKSSRANARMAAELYPQRQFRGASHCKSRKNPTNAVLSKPFIYFCLQANRAEVVEMRAQTRIV